MRNLGVAHITPKKLEQSSTYGELEKLTRIVARMSDGLTFFVVGGIPQAEGDIDEYRLRATDAWRAVQRATGAPDGEL